MAKPVTQQRICYLEQWGEDRIIQMVSDGYYLNDIADAIDPGRTVGISKSFLSQWLQGHLKRNIPWKFDIPGIEGRTERRKAETQEQAEARGKKYEEARKLWAESIVDKAGKQLLDETDPDMAQLRKAQGEYALRIAGIFDKRYAAQQAQVAVQVNLSSSDAHLNALRRREVKVIDVHVDANPLMPGDTVTESVTESVPESE